MADDPSERLRRLEQRLSQASDAAERLISEAARSSERHRPPPAGWQAPGDQEGSAAHPSELESLLQAVRALRDLIPPEVVGRITAALREVLLALRALIDFYLERIDKPSPEDAEVEEIPIE
jgi:hypothetical protein